MIRIRVDDMPAATPNEWYDPSQHTVPIRLDARGLDYYLGVTPMLIDAEHVELIREFRRATIALHGVDHGFSRWRPNSEFQDVNENQAIDVIGQGLHRLYVLGAIDAATKVECFIPPFNMFNQAVLEALKRFAFKIVTGGPESYAQMSLEDLDFGDLQFIPSRGEFYTSHGNFDQIVGRLGRLPADQLLTFHLTGGYS